MAKSKNRKNHKKKVAARNQRLAHEKKQMEKQMELLQKKYVEELAKKVKHVPFEQNYRNFCVAARKAPQILVAPPPLGQVRIPFRFSTPPPWLPPVAMCILGNFGHGPFLLVSQRAPFLY